MDKKPTQKDRILDLLKDHSFHSCRELNEICFRYGARLYELRQEGYEFQEKHTGSHYHYRLKPKESIPIEIEPDSQMRFCL